MNDEKILHAAERCTNGVSCKECPLYGSENYEVCMIQFANYIADKENEPASAPTETSPKETTLHLDDNTLLEICQEAMLKVCDRIIEVDGDAYILGYIHSVLDVINKLKNIKEDKDE